MDLSGDTPARKQVCEPEKRICQIRLHPKGRDPLRKYTGRKRARKNNTSTWDLVIGRLSTVDIEELCVRLRQGGERAKVGGREGYQRGRGECGRRVLPTDGGVRGMGKMSVAFTSLWTGMPRRSRGGRGRHRAGASGQELAGDTSG